MSYLQTITDASKRLTLVVHDTSVGITDADGRVLTLRTDDKKVDERAENGLVELSRTSTWEAPALVSEGEIENGPKVTRRYELSPVGTELHVVATLSGGFGGRGGRGNRSTTQVYDRAIER